MTIMPGGKLIVLKLYTLLKNRWTPYFLGAVLMRFLSVRFDKNGFFGTYALLLTALIAALFMSWFAKRGKPAES